MVDEKTKNKIKPFLFIGLGVVIVLIVIGAVNGFDFKGQSTNENLTPEGIVKGVKEEYGCTCGCGLTLENCEKYDPSCSIRPGIVGRIADLAEQGKNKEEILALLSGKEQPTGQSGNQAISQDDDPVKGSKNAPLTVIEFSDFQCPFCTKFYSETFSQIEKEYIETGKVKFVYRDFPLSFHQYAQKSAEAAECADEQGKFWDYHDILFERQTEWSSGGIAKFKDYARELGLDTAKFNQCLDNGEMAAEVRKDFSDGQSYGVKGTPAFFINGELVSGALSFSAFQQKIEAALNQD